MVTRLKDVAQLARVSTKTVSNVVNGYPYVSDDVRRRVQDAVRKLDYRPNLAARTLRSGRTGLLALVVSDLDGPRLPGLTREVMRAAAKRGFRVTVDHLARDPEPAVPRVDGVLLSADVVSPQLIEAHLATGTPLVLLGEARDARCDHVAIDYARAAHDATEHLLRTGRRRIAAIGTHPGEAAGTPQARSVHPHDAHRTHPRKRRCSAPAGSQCRSAEARTSCAPM